MVDPVPVRYIDTIDMRIVIDDSVYPPKKKTRFIHYLPDKTKSWGMAQPLRRRIRDKQTVLLSIRISNYQQHHKNI